jgi:hypothetical protein
MKTKKIKDLLTGKVLTTVQLSRLVSIDEYKRLLDGEIIHKWEHTKRMGMKEIKLGAAL